jgi:hypothetical protein
MCSLLVPSGFGLLNGTAVKELIQDHLICSRQDLDLFPSLNTTYLDISKMYVRHWKPPGLSEKMCSVNLDASISGKYQPLAVHSGWPSE